MSRSHPERPSLREAAIAVLQRAAHTQGPILDHLKLQDDLGIDSLRAVEIVADIEDAVGAQVPPGSERRFVDVVTVGDLISLLEDVLPLGASVPACTDGVR